MNEKYFESKNLIPKAELLEHASLSLLRNYTAGIPVLMDWVKGGVKKEPLEIFDINGMPLFYDFTVKKGSVILGTIRNSASKILGSPVFAFEFGQRLWNFESALKTLSAKVRKEYPSFKVISNRLVCYSYPKLGIMFESENDPNRKNRLIFDIADYSLIPLSAEKGREGSFAWSFYDSLSEDVRKTRLSRYELTDKWRLTIPARLRKELVASASLAKFVDIKDFICKFKINVAKQLQFCNHYNYNESGGHHCFSLHAQQVNDYCAVATCQMILCYYRYYYAQTDIAPALGYSPGGGCPSDQSAGYESLSNNHLDATFDSTPTWEEARNQIDALHPFKSGISGHARACAGYSYVWWLCDGIKDKKLYIYDPWPWNADYKLGGAVYWEDWDAITHTNYVFTRLLYP